MKTCKNCKHNNKGRCEVINDYFLVKSLCKSDNLHKVDSKMIIKDIGLNEFGCNKWENKE